MPKGGRWSWYQEGDGGREWQPMTNLLKKIDTETFNLDTYKIVNAMVGTALREDIRVGAAAIGKRPAKPARYSAEDNKTLKSLANLAQKAAVSEDGGVLGTAQHTACDRVDAGEPVLDVIRHLPYPYNANVQAYEALIRLNGWEVVEMERTVRMPELDAAGTLDRIYRVPGYGLVIGDEKTEEEPLRNLLKISAQLAGYANSDAVWVPAGVGNGVWAPWEQVLKGEKINRDVAIVVHIRDGEAVPYLVDIKKGYRAALRAAAQRDDVRDSSIGLGAPGAWAFPLSVQTPRAGELLGAAVADKAAHAEPLPVGSVVDVGDLRFTKHAEFPTGAELVGGHGPLPGVAPDGCNVLPNGDCVSPGPCVHTPPVDLELRGKLIDAIWRSEELANLAAVYEVNAGLPAPVPWTGPVAMAGEGRKRIIECPQRSMHDPTTTAKCACGWVRGTLP